MKNKKHLLKSLEKEYEEKEIYLESERRDIYYSALVKDIAQNNRTNQKYKCAFFVIVCFVFLFLCIGGGIVIWQVAKLPKILYADMGVAATGLGSILSSVIVLPKIIAKHLFPENSEKARFDFIKDNQKFDLESNGDFIDDFEDEDNTETKPK